MTNANDTLGKSLHDKAASGEPLSIEERDILTAWQALKEAQAAANSPENSNSRRVSSSLRSTERLERNLDTAINVQRLTVENQALREEFELNRKRFASEKHAAKNRI